MTPRAHILIALAVLLLAGLLLVSAAWGVPRLTLDPWTGRQNAEAAAGIVGVLGVLVGALCGPVVREMIGIGRKAQ